MTRVSRLGTRWLIVVAFAVAMAWVESSAVYYLRALIGRLDPYQADPLPMAGVAEQVELVREAATMVMLLAVGALAGRTWRTRLAYTAIAFGVWDIFYYVFLQLISGWPRSPLDWDVLFLLPLPWWGPVLAPGSIALLMIVGGTLLSVRPAGHPSGRSFTGAWIACWLGVALALYVFMADAIRVVSQGVDATRTVLPSAFNWPLFAAAFALMAAPVVQMAREWARGSFRAGILRQPWGTGARRSL
jgi:hypothetical protein